MQSRLASLGVLACALALGLGACGDDREPAASSEAELEAEAEEEGLSEEERELLEKAEVAEYVPEADRLAHYQLATGSGLLRGRAVAIRRGDPIPEHSTDAALVAAAKRVSTTRPEDRLLRSLRGRLANALRRAPGIAGDAGAKRLLAISDAVNKGLDRYGRREPLIAVFLPD